MKIRLGATFPGSGFSMAVLADRIKTQLLSKSLKSNYPGLLTVANWVMGALLILFALLLIRDIINLSFKKARVFIPVASYTAPVQKKSFQEYASIVKNNPFGAPGGELKQLSAAGGGPAAAVASALTLVGTVSGPQKYGYAFFLAKNNEQEVFKIGEAVESMGVLQRVDRDRVILLSGGRSIEVPMIDAVPKTDGGPSKAGSPGLFARSTGEGSYVVDKKKLQQALDQPGQMMTDARLLPNTVDGKQQGFTINEIKPNGIYQSLGLQNGDVLLRINDFNISSPETALQAMMALKGMDRVNIDIIRSGSKMTMNYMVR